MRKIVKENNVVVGNIYNKYKTANPMAKLMIRNYLSMLDMLVRTITPTSIHEVGCGEGEIITRYAKDGVQLMASDYSVTLIEKAQELHGALKINFFSASIYDLSDEHSAELILCCEVLEHLEDPDRALLRLSELAKPYLVASVPNEPVWRIMNMSRGAYWQDFGNTPGHLQHWSPAKFVELLSTKFETISISKPFPWTMVLCKVKPR